MSLASVIRQAKSDAYIDHLGEENELLTEVAAQFILDFGQNVYDDLELQPIMIRDPEYSDHPGLLIVDDETHQSAYIFKSHSYWMVKRNVNCEAHSVRFEGKLTGADRKQALLLKLGYIWGI